MTDRVLQKKFRRARGMTLIELMIVLGVIGVLVKIALPSYQNYVIRSSRAAAQAELMQLVGMQEKIYLNSTRYTGDLTAAYTGLYTGGLGSTGKTSDGRYTLSLMCLSSLCQTFALTATPVPGNPQESDGALFVDSTGIRMRGSNNSW